MRCLFLVFHRKLRCISYEIKPYEGCAINHTNERNPNMGRTELREHIFKMLFCREFNASKEMPEQLLLYFEQLEQIKDSDRLYIEEKYNAVAEKIEELDQLINEQVTGWKTSRMNKVDFTVLRLAVYEIKWDEDVPLGVAINEAVQLAKKFGGKESPAFVNGVLAKFANQE